MTKKNAEITQFRCEQCNAPYPLGADDVITTCPYCGFTFEVAGNEIKHFIIPNRLDKKSIIPFFRNWLESISPKTIDSRIVKDIDNITPMLEWIPFFRVEGEYSSQFSGYGTMADDSLLFPVEGSNTGMMTEWILARKRAVTYGINKFIESLKESKNSEFKIDMTADAPVLNSEITDVDASKRFQKLCKDQDRKAIQGVVLDHHFNINPESIIYTHAPYWLVRYSYQKGTFRTAISGATGEVLFSELPVTKSYRVKNWLISIIVAIIVALLFQASPYTAIYLGGETGAAGATALILLASLVFAFIPFLLKKSFLYEIEVDKDGNETSEWSGDERVE